MGRVLFNDAAGDLFPGITRGLRGKIVRLCVNDDGSADDLIDGEPIRQKHRKRISVIFQKRRQVARVPGMLAAIGIVMRQRECFPAPFRCYRMTQARKVSGETM